MSCTCNDGYIREKGGLACPLCRTDRLIAAAPPCGPCERGEEIGLHTCGNK